MNRALKFLALAMILALPLVALAQQPTTGTLEGVVVDRDGNPLPGATVVAVGPLGERAVQTDENGAYMFRFLPPGTYRVRAELSGFSTVEVPDVEVSTGQRTRLPITLLPGKSEEITVTSAAPLVDPKRTEVVTNFKSAETVETLPVGRNFLDAATLAPGVVSGGGTGEGNYSIGGASGLENSYIIDGVNITDSGYGGVGTYSIVFGSLGSGITTDFLEEIQVKTAGFEAEYGQALGGVINGVVKSGTNELQGALRAYLTPKSWEGPNKLVRLPTGAINVDERDEQDFGISAGGPIVRDKVFWFAAFNPVSREFRSQIENIPNPLTVVDPGAAATYPNPVFYPGALSGGRRIERSSDNYAAKFNWLATPNHRFELTFFGDPADGDGRSGITAGDFVMDGLGDPDGDGTLQNYQFQAAGFDQGGGRSDIDYGADQQAIRYNGLFGSDWFVEAQISHRKNEFKEQSTVNQFNYRDRRIFLEWLVPPFVFGIPAIIDQGANLSSGGAGFVGPTEDETYDYSLKVSKIWGDHEIKAGFQYFDLEYRQVAKYSGPPTVLNFPGDSNGDGTQDGFVPVPTTSGLLVDVRGGIPGCTLCIFSAGSPYYRIIRGRFNDPGPVTGDETALFIQDTWTINDQWVLKLGLRTTSQELTGSSPFTVNLSQVGPNLFDTTPSTFTPNSYKFDTEISPRIGVTFDPFANGKTKLFAHYARYFERVPADLAVRQFSNEFGVSQFEFTDPLLTNPRGTSIRLQGLTPGVVQPDTKLPYQDEIVLGVSQQLRPDLAVEVRGIYRDQGRVLEDVQFVTNEAILNYYYAYPHDIDGDGTIENVPDPFPGFGQAPFGNYVLANPGENTGNAPFGKPVREYKAMEIQLTKRMANNWQMIANYRYSKLRGNYEGLFRNDNGQSDPNITSLFDFPNSPTMRGQYASGPLNTDRPHVLNILGTYVFDNGFEVGGALQWQSGTPRTSLLAHPNYQNGGEIPGADPRYFVWDSTTDTWTTQPGSGLFLADYTDAPRGSLGRNPDIATIDLHLGYSRAIRDTRLKLTLDVFNLFNIQEATQLDDEVEVIATIPNINFNRILGYQRPRQIRFAAVWNW